MKHFRKFVDGDENGAITFFDTTQNALDDTRHRVDSGFGVFSNLDFETGGGELARTERRADGLQLCGKTLGETRVKIGARQTTDQPLDKREFVSAVFDVEKRGRLIALTPSATQLEHERCLSDTPRSGEKKVGIVIEMTQESDDLGLPAEEVVALDR